MNSSQLELVRGFPIFCLFDKDRICETCTREKQVKSNFKSNDVVSTQKPLKLLHIDLFGLIRTANLGEIQNGFVRAVMNGFSLKGEKERVGSEGHYLLQVK